MTPFWYWLAQPTDPPLTFGPLPADPDLRLRVNAGEPLAITPSSITVENKTGEGRYAVRNTENVSVTGLVHASSYQTRRSTGTDHISIHADPFRLNPNETARGGLRVVADRGAGNESPFICRAVVRLMTGDKIVESYSYDLILRVIPS